MGPEGFDAYVAAWLKHGYVDDSPEGRANLQELKDTMSDNVVYQDVPTGHTYEGFEAFAGMCRFVSRQFKPNLTFVSKQTDGRNFAIEFESQMELGGRTVKGRGVGVGTLGSDGRVTAHRDYYDASGVASAGQG